MQWRYQGVSNLNPRLVAFLLASMLAGLIAAVAVFVAGWGLLAALATNSLVGCLALCAMSVVGVILDGGGPSTPLPAPQRVHA